MEHDAAVEDVAKARTELESERALFAAQQQAWADVVEKSAQQQPQQPGSYVAPDPTALAIVKGDTYVVGGCKPSTGLPHHAHS